MLSPLHKNIDSSNLNELYGPNANEQFSSLAYQNYWMLQDVLQEAHLNYLEKINMYDPNLGSLPNFLWPSLKFRIKRNSIGTIRFARQLDELDEDDHPHQEDFSDLLNLDEATEKEILKSYPDMQDCIDFAKQISGMSSQEAAKMLGITKRGFNYRLKKLCDIARNIRNRNT